MTATELAKAIREFSARVSRIRGSVAINPGHRTAFHWPPHPISYAFHVLPSDWSGHATFEAYDEIFDVDVAKTPYGVFGKCRQLWHEAKGKDEAEMLRNLAAGAEGLFERQFAISECLEMPTRFTGHIPDLGPFDLLRLLYSRDRDVANEARIEIETHASSKVFSEALIAILEDRSHPMRRSAQWCVLDLFEDMRSFCYTSELSDRAIQAMKSLIWEAENDYARTIYKAGVVLGGHLPGERGGPVLIECLESPSRYGRRAAIHGLFHVVEWDTSFKPIVISALQKTAMNDEDPILRDYALAMAADIANGNVDHVAEPVFSDEG